MKSVDLFCTVIDNFGDIGVCRRLALQMHREYGHAVRLWVDDLASFQRLAPDLDSHATIQSWQGLEVRHWSEGATNGVIPADIVIEGFACRLPESFLEAMAEKQPAPVWLNLEYLSAEDWTLGCHGLPSPHPRLPLRQYFFFPGFDSRSGGLLRERDLLAQRDAFQNDPGELLGFWNRLGCGDAMQAGKRISLFAYENPAVAALMTQLAEGPETVFVAVPEGRVLAEVSRWSARDLRAGDRLTRGNLNLAVLPFLSPGDYDRLLWACDLNFVRGEDSFIRAHWAGRPLVWHIYPQDDDAHRVKLEAWLALCRTWLPESWLEVQRQWNHGNISSALWSDWPSVCRGCDGFSRHLSGQPDLAARLEEFCAER